MSYRDIQDLKALGHWDVEWINVARNRSKWRADLCEHGNKIHIVWKAWNFSSTCATVSLSRRSLLYG